MPFYEYQCDNCGHSLEAMQKVSEAPLKKCPHCGKARLKKLMSAPVFRLKGGGWYETDFKSDQDNKRNLADRPEDAPKEDKKDTTDSKDSADTAKPADKAADKPAEKAAAAEPAKKPEKGAASGRAASTAGKSNTRKTAKRPVRKPVKRSTAKPARRR
jgi:putative FmdB family regulatory protein